MSRTSPGGKTSSSDGRMSVLDKTGRQDGTGYQLPPGINRVCYSYLTTVNSNNPQIISLDKNIIQQVYPNSFGNNAYRGGTDGWSSSNGWSQSGMNSTISGISSSNNSGGYTYSGATQNNGEFGNSAYDYFSNHTYLSPIVVAETKHPLSFQFVDSDHIDRNIVYCYSNSTGTFFAIDRTTHFPIIGLLDMANVKNMGVVNSSTFGDGSFSYNAVRKELVATSVTNATTLLVKVFSNVDFNKYPSPATALTREEVTVKDYTVTIPNNGWIAATAYYIKPVLVDNGEIYFILQRSASQSDLIKITLNRASNTGTGSVTSSLTTSSLASAAFNHAPKKMQSRDGSTVCTFGQYYYYNVGAVIWIIDKRKSSVPIASPAPESTGNTSIVPFGDSGWLQVYGSTSTNGNPNGMNGNLRCYERIGADGAIVEIPSRFRPKLPWHASNGSNADYPIISQVADYSVLTGQELFKS